MKPVYLKSGDGTISPYVSKYSVLTGDESSPGSTLNDDLEKTENELKKINKVIDDIRGGGSADSLVMFEAFKKVLESISVTQSALADIYSALEESRNHDFAISKTITELHDIERNMVLDYNKIGVNGVVFDTGWGMRTSFHMYNGAMHVIPFLNFVTFFNIRVPYGYDLLIKGIGVNNINQNYNETRQPKVGLGFYSNTYDRLKMFELPLCVGSSYIIITNNDFKFMTFSISVIDINRAEVRFIKK